MRGRRRDEVVSLDAVRKLSLHVAPEVDYLLDHVLAAINTYGREYPDAYAGCVVSGKTFFVGFTDEPRKHLEKLQQRLPQIDLRAFRAERSYAKLQELMDRVSSDLGYLQKTGIGVAGVGILPQANRLSIMLERKNKSWMQELRRRYGETVVTFSVTGHFSVRPEHLC